ncbi:MAG: hypothetical protein ABH872_07250 [Candidatus Omnitrophota bacterium]
MEVSLDSLIEKIKKEGVDEAKKAQESIVKKAEKEAKEIINQARRQAEQLKADAKKEADGLIANGKSSINQALRDTVLTVRQRLNEVANSVLNKEISGTLSPEFTKELILKIIDKWAPKQNLDLELIISEKDRVKIEEMILEKIKEKAKQTLNIKVSKNINKGFLIGLRDNDYYYEFTDESITEALKEFLNASTLAQLKDKNG